jgi:Uma2 family endonuclease
MVKPASFRVPRSVRRPNRWQSQVFCDKFGNLTSRIALEWFGVARPENSGTLLQLNRYFPRLRSNRRDLSKEGRTQLGVAEPGIKYDTDELEPDISHIEIEDGEPVDNIFSEKQQQLLLDSLEASLREDLRPVVALANVGLFASPDRPPLVPDVMVTFQKRAPGQLDKKKNKTYLIWNYGCPPDIVIEIVSNREGGEADVKLKKYAEWRVGHYVVYDPFEYIGSRKLRTYQLQGRNYVELLEPTRLADFGLGLEIQPGEYRGYEGPWLRWTDESGQPLLTGVEKAGVEAERANAEAERANAEAERANAEAERANAEAERANTEAERAKAEKNRADALAEKLKELGYDSN